jgi:hypothetical protein
MLSHLCYCTDCTKFTEEINDNLPTFTEPGDGMRISKQTTGELKVAFHLITKQTQKYIIRTSTFLLRYC